MKAVTWSDPGSLAVQERDEPSTATATVLVRVIACGICGTDLHLYRGEFPPTAGLVPGHEIAGIVVEGEGFSPGEPVAVDPMLSCLECENCRNAQSPICPRARLMGISADGGMQQVLAAPARNVYRLPAGFDPVLGALTEPLAVCVRGVHRAELPLGARVLVLGAGTIGLMTAMLLRDSAAEVAITGRYPHQRELALKVGASAAFEPDSPDLKAWSRARRPDAVIETVGGGGETLTEAFKFVRAGGVILALGVFTGMAQINGFRLVNDEIRLLSSVMYGRAGSTSEYGVAAAAVARYRAELPVFQTHTFGLEHAAKAFETANDKRSGALKVTILPNG